MKVQFLALVLSFSTCLIAQETKKPASNIFQTLATPDSLSNARVIVYQENRIENSITDRSKTVKAVQSGTGQGFRIQVFSSNAQRTAKSEAFAIERDLKNAFPEVGIYVSYTAPSWKVRVGDFKTSEEAQDFRSELIVAFPNLRNTTYTVKDKINY